MLTLRIVQAEFGDCFLLEFGSPAEPRFILVDGGPETIYDSHLAGELERVGSAGRKLEVAVLSHVDEDHAVGLLDLFADIQDRRANGRGGPVDVDVLWHNSFSRTIGGGNDIEARLRTLLATAQQEMSLAGMAVQGIGEGNRLRQQAVVLGIPLNPGFPDELVLVDTAPGPLRFGSLELRIVGPTRSNLEALKAQWLAWLERFEDAIASDDPFVAAMADRSVPNLSSIMLLAKADGRTLLLTGDGRGDHLLQGLEQAGLLDEEGALHVDVFKLPHHGSDRNVTKRFFRKVTADTYVVSANGKDKNPDLATLIWLVEVAREQERAITLMATNQTPSLEKLLEEYDPAEFDYGLKLMPEGAHSMDLEITP